MSKTNAKGNKNRATPADVSFADPTITVSLESEYECVDVSPSKQQFSDAQEEAIRVLAHKKWEAAGYPAGAGVDFWLDVELFRQDGHLDRESDDRNFRWSHFADSSGSDSVDQHDHGGLVGIDAGV